MKSDCHFLDGIKNQHKKSLLIPFLIKAATNYTLQHDKADPELYLSEELAKKEFGLEKDEKLLALCQFLSLTDLSVEDLEREYLETIFQMEEETVMVQQIEDFITNGSI